MILLSHINYHISRSRASKKSYKYKKYIYIFRNVDN